MIENSIDVVVRINPSSVKEMLVEECGYPEEYIKTLTYKDKSEVFAELLTDYLNREIADFSCNSMEHPVKEIE